MLTATIKASKRQIPFLVWCGGIVFAYTVFVLVGSVVENRFFPVSGGFSINADSQDISDERRSNKSMLFQMTGVRYRKDCEFLYTTWFGLMPGGDSIIASQGYRTRRDDEDKMPINGRLIRVRTPAPQFYGVLKYKCPWQPWLSKVYTPLFDNWKYDPPVNNF